MSERLAQVGEEVNIFLRSQYEKKGINLNTEERWKAFLGAVAGGAKERGCFYNPSPAPADRLTNVLFAKKMKISLFLCNLKRELEYVVRTQIHNNFFQTKFPRFSSLKW